MVAENDLSLSELTLSPRGHLTKLSHPLKDVLRVINSENSRQKNNAPPQKKRICVVHEGKGPSLHSIVFIKSYRVSIINPILQMGK